MLDSFCMGNMHPFHRFLKNNYVFLRICDGKSFLTVSSSVPFDFSLSPLTSSVVSPLFVQSFAAMLFTVILH